MKKMQIYSGVIVAVMVLLSACAPAVKDQSSQPPYTITASGSGKVYLTPDIAYINFGAHTEAATVSEALSKNNEQAQALSKTLIARISRHRPSAWRPSSSLMPRDSQLR